MDRIPVPQRHGYNTNRLLCPLLSNRLDNRVNVMSFDADARIDRALLKSLAGKYIWWKTPDEAVAMPERVIAQVMNIGDYGDVQVLAARVGDEVLRDVLTHADPGQFNERSWAYWHYRLGLAGVDQVPAMPSRRLA